MRIRQEWFGEWILYQNNHITITWFDPRSWFYYGWLFRFKHGKINCGYDFGIRVCGLELSVNLT